MDLWLAEGIEKSTDNVELDSIVEISCELHQINMQGESYLIIHVLSHPNVKHGGTGAEYSFSSVKSSGSIASRRRCRPSFGCK